MKIVGWVESVTFIAVVSVVSHFWGLLLCCILLYYIFIVLAFEVRDAIFFSGNFEIFLINSSTGYISKDLLLIKHLLYDLNREHTEANLDTIQHGRYLS